MKSKTVSIPKICVCKKKEPGNFEHSIGFSVGAIVHITMSLFLGANLVDYLATGRYERMILYFAGAWLFFWLAIYLLDYLGRKKQGHSRQCANRHGLLGVVFFAGGSDSEVVGRAMDWVNSKW